MRSVVEQHGWRDTTMSQVAAALGVSRMTLHRHGVTRQAVLDRLAALMEGEAHAAMAPAVEAGGSGRERLVMALEAVCANSEANLSMLAALEDADRDALYHEEGEGALTRGVFTDPIQRILRDGVADGSLAVQDVSESATVLFNMVGWTYRHMRVGHRWTAGRARRSVVEIAVRGVSA